MRILYTGPLGTGETCEMRRRALGRLGHETIPVDYLPWVRAAGRLARRIEWRLRAGPFVHRYNHALLAALATRPDLLWVDKGMFVLPSVLEAARRAGVRWLVHYSPDNYLLRQNTSRHLRRGLPLYDVVVTTKSHNVAALEAAGARRVVLSGNAYAPDVHRPVELEDRDRAAFGCDVSFIGRWERSRERLLGQIAARGVDLCVRGPGWETAPPARLGGARLGGPVHGDDYAKAIAGAKINLGLLSRLASDTITQRSVELPACGVFMLAERTGEHLAHFTDGEEAAFFDGPEEAVAKVDFYLANAAERRRIATGGRERCLRSAYSYDDRLAAVLGELEKEAA